MHKRIALNGMVLLGVLAGATAVADTQPGFYAGAGLGQATIEIDGGFDADDTAFKIFGGYNINQNFAVELAYFDGGSAEQSVVGGSVDVSTDGLIVSALGRVPVGDAFSLFGKLGFASYDAQIDGRVGNQVVASESGSDEDLAYGIGGAFNLGPSFELRAEYEAISISDGDFTILSVSGLYKF
jgi:OmpA-OmpF porin, OOP family